MRNEILRRTKIGTLLAGGAFLVGCSAAQPPRDTLGAAELAVRRAQVSTASQHAGAELLMARDKLEAAKRAMRGERYEEARRLAEQALVDAQLAETTARTVEAQRVAREMRANIESLRRETERSSGRS
jgi:hypothetical protein